MAQVGPGTFGFLCGLAQREELPGPVVTRLLQELGLTPAGARTYLSRMVYSGDLNSRRAGRHSIYSMTGNYLAEFHRLSIPPVPPQWEGAFHLVLFDIPESERPARDALQRAAHAHGFRPLRPGAYVGNRPPGEWLDARAYAGRWSVDNATARRVIAAAWDVDSSAERIRSLAASRGPALADAALPDAALVAAVTRRHSQLFVALRHLPPFPVELLPDGYPVDELDAMLDHLLLRELPAAGAAMARLVADV
ncbi:hypothetical protein [uncultured Corynebacterium sp.]|uniref:hypothetical protein n=1 Tax=uncultured Corynebacterium sp. TaxID=159447 RepID=UPI0025E3060B|nr:hypothetical protein [uncultured Corynebacterium sp.]